MAAFSFNLEALCESLLWPLNVFYAQYERELPEITPLFGQHLPEPYKTLLAHQRNMTPTLEAYHHSSLYIERLNEIAGPQETTREVILRTDTTDQPVEYGASRVFLQGLPQRAVDLIHEGRLPLGTILLTCGCTHTIEPAGFFKIKSTPFFVETLSIPAQQTLYGRRNCLIALDGQALAEVCEVLPPHDLEIQNRG